jgi:hypothetical protein
MKRANLMLHCGAANVDRQQVYETATPQRTASWVPVGHGTLLDQVQGSLESNGLHVVTEAHGLARDGQRYFGLLQVANGDNPADFGLVVGVRNSHDKSFPAAMALGAAVFVCDNLSFSGEVKLARKHTVYIERDLRQLVGRAIGLLGGLRRTQEDRFAAYKQCELSDSQAHDLMIRSLDAQVLPVTKLPDVLHEWRQPRHPEFAQDWTAWRLFNSFTETLKGNVDRLPKRTQALHGLMDAACGLTVPPGQPSRNAGMQVTAAA